MFSALGKNWDRCLRFCPTYSIDVIVEGKRKRRGKETPRKEIGYRVCPDVNRIGRPNTMISILIFPGLYRQLL